MTPLAPCLMSFPMAGIYIDYGAGRVDSLVKPGGSFGHWHGPERIWAGR